MEQAQKCMIIGASPLQDGRVFKEFLPEEYFIICADGGFETALHFGVQPDLVIGDFDSATDLPPDDLPTILLPVEKDVTDMQAAVMEGFKRGYSSFVLIGGMGGPRLDHTIANMQVLDYIAEHGGPSPNGRQYVQNLFDREREVDIDQHERSDCLRFPI